MVQCTHMNLDDECRQCLYRSQLKKVTLEHPNDKRLDEFKRQTLELCQNASAESCAPLLMRGIDGIHRKIFGGPIDYSREKSAFNRALLNIEGELYEDISHSRQPIKTAIKYAMAANYIDFARFADLDGSSVDKVMDAATKAQVDNGTYEQLLTRLGGAKTLVYLHDNCGEIVLDKLLIRAITAAYPAVKCISVVRGGAIINDATLFDAQEVGLAEVAGVTDSGAAIPGTYLPEVNAGTRRLLGSADVIISKGLGNLETLYGADYPIYYMFMCKCEHIAARFQKTVGQTALIS